MTPASRARTRSRLRARTLRSALLASCAIGLVATPTVAAVVGDPVQQSSDDAALTLDPVGSYETGVFDASAAEIVGWYAAGHRTLVVNAQSGTVDVLDTADPTSPVKVSEISGAGVEAADGSVVPEGTVANSVAVRDDGLAVVALEAPQKTENGWLLVVDVRRAQPVVLGAYRVGALPDMVTLTPRGERALVANEGEPTADYGVDPEGTVSVVELPQQVDDRGRSAQHGSRAVTQDKVRTADFHAFEGEALPEGVRLFGGREDAGTGLPARPVSENLEPEYVTVSADGRTAWVSLQEANALAVVDVRGATVTDLLPLGTVDRTQVPFDPSDRDGEISLGTWPVQGFRLPDAIDSYRVGGTDYVVTANEGDARDYDAYSEEARVKDLGEGGLPPVCDGVAEEAGMTVEQLQADENLGRLTVTLAQGLDEEAGCYAELFTYGTRGFSILDGEGSVVFDAGAQFEEVLAEAVPDFFNSNHSETNLEGRSDDKGPEPEGVVLGEVEGRTYAFIGLERIGGVMVYDVTDPAAASFVTYVNNRDFSVSVEDAEDVDAALAAAGDLGAEGLAFIPADESATGAPLLVVANEVSGTTTTFEVTSRG